MAELVVTEKDEVISSNNDIKNKRRHRRNLSVQVGEMLINEKDEASKVGIDLSYDQEKAEAEALLAEEKLKRKAVERETDGHSKVEEQNNTTSRPRRRRRISV